MALGNEEEALIKAAFRQLVDRPLEPGDPLYQDIYSRPDGEDPIAKLQTRIEFAEIETLQFFSGFDGSGKTTELFRLRGILESKGYLVLYSDSRDYIDQADSIDVATLLMAIAGSFSDALEKKVGQNVLAEGYWTRLRNYLKNTSVTVTEASVSVDVKNPAEEILGSLEAGIDLKSELRTSPSFRRKLKGFLGNRLGEFKAEVDRFIVDGVKAARATRKDLPIVFLFDQFEQLRGSRTSEQPVIHSVEQLFANHVRLLQLPFVHVIYTVPPWLQFVLPGQIGIEILPAVRLWNCDEKRTRYPAGWKIFREVIAKRFDGAGFKSIFGGEPGKEHALADQLIEMSGGHFRDLLRLFRELLLLARTWTKELPATQKVIDRAIANVRNEFLPIASDDAMWLAKIASLREPALSTASPEQISRLSRFLNAHMVLYLTNGKDWYDVHPLIRNTISDEAKRATAEKAKPSEDESKA